MNMNVMISDMVPINGAKNYLVGKNGNVFSLRTNTYLNPSIAKNGYKVLNLKSEEGWKVYYLHRILAEAFIPNESNKRTVNHKDGCKTNNALDNLEWATDKENIRHAFKTGLQKNTCKEVMCVETGVIYPSGAQAARELNLMQSSVSRSARIGYQVKGYHFKFIKQKNRAIPPTTADSSITRNGI